VGGKLGACDALQPSAEVCDGKDNDCNTKIDDGAVCTDSARTCARGSCRLKDGQPCQTSDDCGSGTCIQGVGVDADGDGFGDKNGPTFAFCTAPPSGYAANKKDCCDRDGNVNPNHTDFEWKETTCGGWDWNCDGVEKLKYPDRFSCDNITDGWNDKIGACGATEDWTTVHEGGPGQPCGIVLGSMQQLCN
jgi:hypothetical protein